MRWLAGIAAALLAFPAGAQEAEADPDWVGVWEGTVGNAPVVACLDTRYNGSGIGSYYYRKHLEPIGLWMYPDEPGWKEHPPGEDNGARWHIDSAMPDALTGTWRDGKRELPIRLTPLDWQNAETPYMPCEAPAFIEPRLAGGEVVLEAGDTDGIAFIEHEYRNPPHLDVLVQGFSLFEDQPGDAAINAAVAQYNPTGKLDDDWVDCLSGAAAHLGGDGYFDRTVRPSMITDEFVSITIGGSVYCGGAHPNHFVSHRLFDRQSGEEIELDQWFADTAFTDDEYETRPMTEAFRNHVLSFATGDEYEAECIEMARGEGYWDLELTRSGISFTPEMAHAVTPCEVPVLLSWDALDAWLNDAGRAGKARLPAGPG